MKPVFPLLCCILLMCCVTKRATAQSQPVKHHPKKLSGENRALARVRSVYEVRNFLATTPKSYKPILMVERDPDSTFKYYWISMGIRNFDMFRTTEAFYVDPKTWKVYYKDDMVDSGTDVITLKQWRYWRKFRAFNNLHTYKAGKLVVLRN